VGEARVNRTRTVQGIEVPAFIYGTAWKEDQTETCVARALQAGFAAIDTANQRRHYVEIGVGDAVAASKIPREKLFLQTKFTSIDGQDDRLPYDPNADTATQVRQSFESSLKHLRTTYVDSYVLHGPASPRGLAQEDVDVWRAMETLHREGGARLLGVSNVSLEQLEAFYDLAEIKPAFVQNRCYARLGWNRPVREFCRAHEIVYQGFSLLTANGRELMSPVLAAIVRRTGRTPAQVVFGFAMRAGMIPLTGTTDPAHMAEDLGAFDVDLSAADLDALERISG
jgi:diketogulonate reductase-like aldo/keto reductase